MLNKFFYKFSSILICFSLFILLSKCNLKSQGIGICKSSYANASKDLNDYYRDSEQYHLQIAIQSIDSSMGCSETRVRAVSLKVSLLVLLKKYKNGYEFIDSLSENDFAVKYQKNVYRKYFQAMESESKADTVGRNKLLGEIVSEIQDYIQHENNPKGLDETAYYDLFIMKTRLSGMQQVEPEIDSLKAKYPDEHNFLDGMKNTLKELPR